MSTPDPNSSETSKMKRILNAGSEDNPYKARLPRGSGGNPASQPQPPPPVYIAQPIEGRPDSLISRLLPAFWTIASLISLGVNVVLIVILLIVLQMLGTLQLTANDQVSGLLGGLYHNFVKMDQATISRNIPVDANIPLNIVVPVQATTRITLAENVVIPNAHVRINTGSLNINADAVVTLPANTPLMVTLDFPLNVQNTIPVHLDVPVNIPLRETQLHEPFVGLQQVIEPWYCLVEPNALVNGVQICSPLPNPPATGP